jgi:hypothetical protein
MSFVINCSSRPLRGLVAYTLIGEMPGRPDHPLCRYDIQASRHRNPQWWPPPVIPPRVIHRHLYNERAVREGQGWDWCADLVLAPELSARHNSAVLSQVFIDGIALTIQDPEVRDLFSRM